MLAVSVSPQDPPGFREVLPVLYEKKITAQSLQLVINGSKLALVIPKFYLPQDAEILAKRLLKSGSWDTYSEQGANDVGRLGKALFDCAHKAECDIYFDTADK